jgi:hypothetical protein
MKGKQPRKKSHEPSSSSLETWYHEKSGLSGGVLNIALTNASDPNVKRMAEIRIHSQTARYLVSDREESSSPRSEEL